jgi:hypothetical protein
MASRDTAVHAAVVALAVVLLVALNALFPDLESRTVTFAVLLLYGLVLAGAHLFLAWLGEDGIVPVASRWRFVGMVALVLLLMGVVLLSDPVTVAGVSSDAVVTVLGVGVVLAYWVLEAGEGYQEAQE